MVTDGIGKAASHEMSVTLSEGAVTLSPKLKESQDREVDQSLRAKSASELETSKIIDKAAKNRLAVDILKPFVSKLAEAGIALNIQQTAIQKGEEGLKDFMEREGGLDDVDKVQISSTDTPVITQIKGLKKQFGQQSQGFAGGQDAETMALLKEYAGTYVEFLASQSPELSGKLKELRQKLLDKGISEAKLKALDASLKSGSKIDLGELLKEALLMEQLAGSPIEKMTYRRGVKDILSRMDPMDVKEAMREASEKVRGDVQGFVLEELESTLIKKTFMQDHDYSDAIKLLELGESHGLDYGKWLSEVWPKKKDDHGLYLLDVPHAATGMNVNTSTDNPDQNQASKHGYEYEQKDENEVLVNRLRALYMQRAFKGDAMTRLQTEFKIRKLKNGLMKLGIFTKDMDEQVKHEAEIVAKIKLIEMLKEALIERATFYELAGPAYELVEKKIKGLLKNAERLAMPISAEEFRNLRDKANRRVFDISKKELDEVIASRQAKDSDFLVKKEKLLVRLLTRLKEESQIEDSFASFS
ncbi:hypothetical protein A2311_01505 [candidate division WOR-1 bacterium RIFOXYB2_FULL_48_7]|uniref:Uncharacterized protein n=1 Tax=candidate division WOR-1 bacterium RIFOXYB2_FULL_48_7 TaxID=1802583 RepID=A0A1F4TRH5_UNCSA|nr:MAG: hypothetical protein A2311_01505 [candidate division WOR-1 bacterium RIFOXYB2_FULL_48_7]